MSKEYDIRRYRLSYIRRVLYSPRATDIIINPALNRAALAHRLNGLLQIINSDIPSANLQWYPQLARRHIRVPIIRHNLKGRRSGWWVVGMPSRSVKKGRR